MLWISLHIQIKMSLKNVLVPVLDLLIENGMVVWSWKSGVGNLSASSSVDACFASLFINCTLLARSRFWGI